MASNRRVVITGIGMVTPLGHTLADTMVALAQGESGLAPVISFDATGFPVSRVGEVRDFNARDYFRVPKAMKLTDRTSKWAIAAAVMALEDGGWNSADRDMDRLGVLIGASAGNLQPDELSRAIGPDPARRCVQEIPFFAERVLSGLNPLWLLVNLPNMTSAHVAIQIEAHGPSGTIMTDWTAGIEALGEAADWIRSGEAEAVLAGGSESAVDPLAFAAYERAGLLRATPDPKDAGGFTPGEGAAVLLLEEREHALERAARIYGEICGYASASLPPPAPAGPPTAALEQTMRDVIAETGWTTAEIAMLVTATGESRSAASAAEDAALTNVLGHGASLVSRTEFKSRLGHALAASGPIDLGLTVRAQSERGVKGGILCNAHGCCGAVATIAVFVH